VINALNRAPYFMADFEDANCRPAHMGTADHLRDEVRRTISFEQSGKRYTLQTDRA